MANPTSHFDMVPLDAHHARPWYYFDPGYYLAQCIDRSVSPPLGTSENYQKHFADRGTALGLSPNPLFDEDYYRRRHPNVAREIEMGMWLSAFHHYSATGANENYSPIWFFDGLFYQAMHEDLTQQNLKFGGFSDLYAHYLLVGIKERRAGHWIVHALKNISPEYFFPTDAGKLASTIAGEADLPNLFKPVFDLAWMKEKYMWGDNVPTGRLMRHYILNVKSKRLSPSPYFDESFYLNSDPEIEASVKNGTFSCGYEHFTRFGLKEWRRPFATFDPHFYVRENMAPPQGRPGITITESPFAHFLRNRRTARLAISPPLSELDIQEDIGKGLYERRCALNSEKLRGLLFSASGSVPDVSILIVARDSYEQTANCIVSAAYNTRASIEVVLFDNGSRDNVRNIPTINSRIKYLRSPENLGFTIAVNRCAEIATGRILLLLNNDAELAPGAIDLALATLDTDRSIGAIGGKVIRMHGRLQEAGSIIWRDGTCLGYGRDRDPRDGQVSVLHDVDFCSGCFLAIPKSHWEMLNGFDEAYAPAYYEETDFCLRLWGVGLRVVYDPRIMIWHFEFGTSSVREESLALMRRNQRYFVSKNKKMLSECLAPSRENIEQARFRHVTGQRVLFIEDMIPNASLGMGFVRSASIVRELGETCGLVSFLGLHNHKWPSYLARDASARCHEVLTNVNISNIEEFIQARKGVYDTLWLSRTHNLPLLKRLRDKCPDFFNGVRVILDTEAIAAVRKFAYAEQAGKLLVLQDLLDEEFEHLEGVGHICTVNDLDRTLLRDLLERRGLSIEVSVLGHSLGLQPTFPSFEGTSDILLVGAYSLPDGPNADAVLWFDKAVRPLIPELPGMRFVIAGSGAQEFANGAGLTYEYHVMSDVPNMADVYRTARIMVAPTRFAAGIPMKVHEAASYGVPVVMTDLLAHQLGWQGEGIAAAPAEPERLASAIATYAVSKELWELCQSRQARLIESDCDPDHFNRQVRNIIGDSIVPEGERRPRKVEKKKKARGI